MTDELRTRDDLPTLLALGVLAYTLETMIHELAGHGGVCLIQGHKLLLVTPLWMRCDVVSPLMVAAGPVANMVAALVSWIALRTGLAVTLKAVVRLALFRLQRPGRCGLPGRRRRDHLRRLGVSVRIRARLALA